MSEDSQTKTVRILTWNVDGLRATVKKGLLDPPLLAAPYDVVCLQETKSLESQAPLSQELKDAYPYRAWGENRGEDYKTGRGDGQRKGLSGTAIFSRHPFLRIIPSPEPIREGRLTIVEFPHLIVVSTYVPNSGAKMRAYRTGEWDEMFCRLLRKLNAYKSTVVTGDMNVCHENHDICSPERSKNRIAGFLNLERQQFRRYFELGYQDAFRCLYPQQMGAFTWWNRRFPHLRAQNKGWRLDYVMVNKDWSSKPRGEKGDRRRWEQLGEEEEDWDPGSLPPLQAFTTPYNPSSTSSTSEAVANRKFGVRGAIETERHQQPTISSMFRRVKRRAPVSSTISTISVSVSTTVSTTVSVSTVTSLGSQGSQESQESSSKPHDPKRPKSENKKRKSSPDPSVDGGDAESKTSDPSLIALNPVALNPSAFQNKHPVLECTHHTDVFGSDHCPVSVVLRSPGPWT